jgi:hypothetical protein
MQPETVLPIARNLIRKLNGVVRTAEICGVRHSSVCAWDRPVSRKGTGGLVPQRHHRAILAYAQAHPEVDIKPQDLLHIPGQEEVAA